MVVVDDIAELIGVPVFPAGGSGMVAVYECKVLRRVRIKRNGKVENFTIYRTSLYSGKFAGL